MSRDVICYCLHVSHVLNLGRIPALLAEKGWRVRWLNAFPAESFPLERAAGVEYTFNMSLAELGELESDLYLSPYVGQSSHFPARAKRVHFLVSLTSLEGVYDESMFDHYDAIACAGRHQVEEFEALGRRRNWQGKQLLPMGYPKLDGQRRQLADSSLAPAEDALTVVFAPTHAYYINQGYSVLRNHGEQIVEAMLADGIRVVFRPHVESWRDQDKPVVEGIVERFGCTPGFTVDRSGNYFDQYAQTNLMLTDISGTGFTYAFTFGRPALFFAPDAEQERGKRGIQFERRDNIGLVVRGIDELVPRLRLAQRHFRFLHGQIAQFRDWLIFNIGESEASFVEMAETLVAGRPATDRRRA
ncbi:CDP-glycerol glycerophosphotransferase family protein [Pseudomonas sp. BN411]|uniref:CDP-glycerol glycerophosphotransferase family protein n=1 Tax=Pseudomonas sp. BN411 TaxID=2567887 RepID=UPI0024580E19|nr:CDP-glycerol glycerophosphotransferase family protein [Pseudomonas sp. BN411]MDH4562703.1 hypothetical protein [Pseudomonas sp. BN411]